MLIWHKELWLIDHGAALYFHHSGQNWEEQSQRPFAPIKDHVLLPRASELETVDTAFRAILTPELIQNIVAQIPAEWLTGEEGEPVEETRQMYAHFLNNRIAHSEIFVQAAQHARKALI